MCSFRVKGQPVSFFRQSWHPWQSWRVCCSRTCPTPTTSARPPVRAQINYLPFRKCFYTEVAELARMSDEEVAALRKELDGIKVAGGRGAGRGEVCVV